MTQPPASPKIYHITHVDNLGRIASTGVLLSDRLIAESGAAVQVIVVSAIKRRRIEEFVVTSHPATRVGDHAPFYFCPRSVILREIGERPVGPKTVAATATVRRAQEQIQALFARPMTQVFPPPAPGRRASFFARTVPAAEVPARLYLGVAAHEADRRHRGCHSTPPAPRGPGAGRVHAVRARGAGYLRRVRGRGRARADRDRALVVPRGGKPRGGRVSPAPC